MAGRAAAGTAVDSYSQRRLQLQIGQEFGQVHSRGQSGLIMRLTELAKAGYGLVETRLIIAEAETRGLQFRRHTLHFALFHEEGKALILGGFDDSQLL